MASKDGFWRGVLVGAGAGFALARLLGGRRPFLRPSAGSFGSGPHRTGGSVSTPLRRDEGGGDPQWLMAANTGTAAGLERAGGAPGGADMPEASSIPGQPGQTIEYARPDKPVRP